MRLQEQQIRIVAAVVIALVCISSARAENLAPSTDQWIQGGADNLQPDWKNENKLLFRTGSALGVKGTGEDSAFWRSQDLKLYPGSCYLFRFRMQGKSTGLVISGLNSVNRDMSASPKWTDISYAFRVPEKEGANYLRLGQWHLTGEVLFDKPELHLAQVVHRKWGDMQLGDGERISNGEYVDNHLLSWQGSTIHRTIHKQNAYFNTNRWAFGASDYIEYRHTLPLNMNNARLSINVNYHTGGTLIVSASRDGTNWVKVGEISRTGTVEQDVPKELLPAKDLFVRIEASGKDAYLQVDNYIYRAEIPEKTWNRLGRTVIVEEKTASPYSSVKWDPASSGFKISWQGTPDSRFRASYKVDNFGSKPVTINPTEAQVFNASIPLEDLSAGQHKVLFQIHQDNKLVYEAETTHSVAVINDSSYGYPLKVDHPDVDFWWCEGGWKVGLDRQSPSGKAVESVMIEAAKGEYEPAQIVIRPGSKDLTLNNVSVSDLTKANDCIPSSSVSIHEVAFVQVENVSDYLGDPGAYPDPLPLLQTPLKLAPNKNQPLWVSVQVPENASAGMYKGAVTLNTNAGKVRIPLSVRVFDFKMPRETHLRSGFGLDPFNIKKYHHLASTDQEKQVWDLYMRSFAEHRIAPYSFYHYSPIEVKFEGERADKKVKVDFAAFDKAAKLYLDGYGFNAWQLPINGLGWGTFFEMHEGEFGGFASGTPEYNRLHADYLRQIETHLKSKGWLDKAYVYWFDEPEINNYPFVIEGMKKIKNNAPGIRRLLTEQPEPPLFGHVDIWCGLTPMWSQPLVSERRKAGEEVWWYICTAPKAPYIGLFIEHPAAEMRLWPWQSWQYGVEGILIWQTNYWNSPVAFGEKLQDPWEDPMSYVSGYGVPTGTRQFWGNGDGRFFYPPRRDLNKPQAPAIEPPVTSIRWENLRDGMEDYEYLFLLKEEIERVKSFAPMEVLRKAEALLKIPADISADLTNFTSDPRPILDHRRKVAAMIEQLRKMK